MLIPSVRGHGLGKLALALAAAVFVSTLAAENCAKQAKASRRPPRSGQGMEGRCWATEAHRGLAGNGLIRIEGGLWMVG